MADTKKLKRFHVEQADDEFRLHVEDESGTTLELAASREQLDVIADALDELLSQTEGDDEIDD